jgi:pyruvate carboxylase subunit B
VIECRPADLLEDEMHTLREEIGETARTPEDVLTYAMFPEIGRAFLEQRNAGTLAPEPLEPLKGADEESGGAPVEFNVTLHGETYHIKLTGTGHKTQQMRPFYLTVDGVPEEIIVETLDEILPEAPATTPTQAKPGKTSERPRATKPGDVTTSMPGTIIDVLVNVGDSVNAGDPVLVTEAMKMETEVQATISGKVSAVHVHKGDRVTPDETLVEIE